MPTDDTAFLQFFLQDELYLLKEDKAFYTEGPAATPTEEKTPEPQFNCLGNNNKQFLILVHYSDHEHMDPAHQKALESTLGRKELTLADVAILNVAKVDPQFQQHIISFYKPAKLVVLGSTAVISGLPSININTIAEGDIKQLHTYSFTEMLADREKAKSFWEQMKNF